MGHAHKIRGGGERFVILRVMLTESAGVEKVFGHILTSRDFIEPLLRLNAHLNFKRNGNTEVFIIFRYMILMKKILKYST